MTDKLVITTNFHPNEKVAKLMAGKVAGELQLRGVDVQVAEIDGEGWPERMDNNMFCRYDDREMVLRRYPGRTLVDFHDSDIEEVAEVERQFKCQIPLPAVIDDSAGFCVEVGAAYVPQLDSSVSKFAKNHGIKNGGYFSKVSDIKASAKIGLMGQDVVYEVADLILRKLAKK